MLKAAIGIEPMNTSLAVRNVVSPAIRTYFHGPLFINVYTFQVLQIKSDSSGSISKEICRRLPQSGRYTVVDSTSSFSSNGLLVKRIEGPTLISRTLTLIILAR